jgi:hypothetical protein
MEKKKSLLGLSVLSGLGLHKAKIIVLSFCTIFCMSFSLLVHDNPPDPDHTGSPSDGVDCTDCHGDFAVNSGSATVTITSNIPACGYTAGNTYTVTAAIVKPGGNLFQFELSPQNAAGTYLGTLIPGTTTQLDGTKDICGKLASLANANSQSWTFTWTAPAASTGNVTFYAAFNEADGDGTEAGDHIYTKSLLVPEGGPYSASVTSTNPNCNSLCTGTATANAICGTAPYTYAWNSTPVQTTQTATGLCAGSYTVLVIDALAATKTATVTITQPTALTASVSSTDQTTSTPANGTATAAPSGGTAPYTFAWSTTPVQTSATATGLAGANYTVAVTDSKGCAQSYTVTVNSTVGMASFENLHSVTAYPNPTAGNFYLEINSLSMDEYSLTVVDVTGKMVYSETLLLNKGNNIRQISLEAQSKGVFFIELKSKSGAIKVVPVAKVQ